MKYLIILLILMGCSSAQNKEELRPLALEKKFLIQFNTRPTLLSQTYTFPKEDNQEKDLVLKALIDYYPFADVKTVISQIKTVTTDPSPNLIETYMKNENTNLSVQMIKIIDAFQAMNPEQLKKAQAHMDALGLQIRTRQQKYKSPMMCFNDKDCANSLRCVAEAFCAAF